MLRARYNRGLFTLASVWNLGAAAVLLIHPDFLLERLDIVDPAARLLARSFVSSIATWGIGYALIAIDQKRYRDFAWLGVISKTIFFAVYMTALLNRQISVRAFLPAIVDLILAVLFLEFLLRTKRVPPR